MDNVTTGLPITATDHTAIAYTNVGVGTVATTVSDSAGGPSVTTYYPNETLYYSSTITGGIRWQNDDTIVDPLVLISLPSGINLDTSSVTAVSKSGNHSDGSSFSLVQVSGTTTQVIDGVEWTTYKFTSKTPLDMGRGGRRAVGGNRHAGDRNDDAVRLLKLVCDDNDADGHLGLGCDHGYRRGDNDAVRLLRLGGDHGHRHDHRDEVRLVKLGGTHDRCGDRGRPWLSYR